MSFKFRDYRQEDGGFVYPTLLRSYKFKNPIANNAPESDYGRNLDKWLKLSAKKSTRLVIACDDECEDLIIGFILCNPADKVIYYTYVKAAFRGAGVASALFGHCGLDPKIETIFYTHWTADVLHFSNKWRFVYNPYMFRWPRAKEDSYVGAEREDFESSVSHGATTRKCS